MHLEQRLLIVGGLLHDDDFLVDRRSSPGVVDNGREQKHCFWVSPARAQVSAMGANQVISFVQNL